jgi:sialic acid synthase SpsE
MTTDTTLSIAGRRIGRDEPVYFVADIAANHDGDVGRAVELIQRAAQAGADAAKFQHFRAETIVSDVGFKALAGPQSHQAKWKKSVFEVYQDASVSLDWTPTLKRACDEAGITFFTSPTPSTSSTPWILTCPRTRSDRATSPGWRCSSTSRARTSRT